MYLSLWHWKQTEQTTGPWCTHTWQWWIYEGCTSYQGAFHAQTYSHRREKKKRVLGLHSMSVLRYISDREVKMEVVLFRLQKQESRLLTCLDSTWTTCLLATTPIVTSKSGSTLDKRGSESCHFWAPGGLANPPGSKKSHDSQDETAL